LVDEFQSADWANGMTTCNSPNSAQRPVIVVGFDSAWADNPKSPGAICAVEFDGERVRSFQPPELVNFARAAEFIERLRLVDRAIIVAIDQPTVVPNLTGMRPVDRLAASLVSWLGGGVQPASRSRTMFFGDRAPLWRFLERINAILDPEAARTATSGVYAVEVFPALALASIDGAFFGRLQGPRYNPQRKTFKLDHWNAVVAAMGAEASRFGLDGLIDWLDGYVRESRPSKRHQDELDAVICLLVGLRWRLRPREESVMLGDVEQGHIIAPASAAARERLLTAARKMGVALDGIISVADVAAASEPFGKIRALV